MSDAGLAEKQQIPQAEKTGISGEKPKPDTRQQSKIIGTILREDPRLISIHAVVLGHSERNDYLKRVANGQIGEAEYLKVLGGIKTPIENEKDESDPVSLYSQISGDKQLRGIVSYFAKGDLGLRDSLTSRDLHILVREKFPNALAFEKAVGGFLDQIEGSNDKQKRAEYESKVEIFGRIAYGKQWEYLKQIRLLEDEAQSGLPQNKEPDLLRAAGAVRHQESGSPGILERIRYLIGKYSPGEALELIKQLGQDAKDSQPATPAIVESPEVRNLQLGYEQAQIYAGEHRLSGKIMDGFKDGDKALKFDVSGNVINNPGEVIVIDRNRDERLQVMINTVKAIQAKYGDDEMRTVFETSKLIYGLMHDPKAREIINKRIKKTPAKEVLLGDLITENGQAGVCRHRALLFQVLAEEAGINTTLARGFAAAGDSDPPVGHAWNEIDINGRRFLIDIMNPPGGRNFGNVDYSTFMNENGFPVMGINRNNIQYMDINGRELFKV